MGHHLGLSPAASVQLFQALVAREMVEGLGAPLRQTSELLGLAPSAISQYLSGKRLSEGFTQHEADPRALRLARTVAERVLETRPSVPERTRLLLEGAGALIALTTPGAASRPSARPGPRPTLDPRVRRQLVQWLRRRVRAEQAAVSECMHLAQRARDELTRAVFRQIASDSLRHAEIVASLAAYLERGIARTPTTGVTRQDILHLIAAEEKAEAGGLPPGLQQLEGTMAVLLESMGADERKHDEILRRLLELEADAPSNRARASRSRTRPRGGARTG